MSNAVAPTDKILDTSVVAKWFIEEDGSDRARLYLSAYKDGKFSIIVPSLLFYELGNVLLFKKGTVQQVGRVMEALRDLQLTRVEVGFDSFRKIYQNAQELRITFYDAAYVTLLQGHPDSEFVTADEKLFHKLRKVYSSVKLL